MKKAFLRYVAEDIVKKWGEDMSQLVVVFPNKRASLFLNQYIYEIVGHATWSPRYLTISELMRQQSKRTVCDQIEAICLLYETYSKVITDAESIDKFWSWGEMILADFDDLDKNMGSAEKIFCNVRDLKVMDSLDYLDEEQKSILKRFFQQFTDEHESILKQRFERLWNKLYTLYYEYNKVLADKDIAYEGALYREVAEKADQIAWKYDHYLFVGFNMVQVSEQRLMRSLQKQKKAHFYWDFDNYYLDNRHQEAGNFIRQYLYSDNPFSNELDKKDKEIYNQFSEPKDVTILSAPTEDIQARYVAQWLREKNRINPDELTAVVLADEQLLARVIHYLPKEISSGVNITIGYPLALSQISGEVRKLFQKKTPITDIITELKRWNEDTQDAMQQEAAFRMYTILNRISELQQTGLLQVDHSTMVRLLDQIIKSTSMPFHGEPVVGIQIMGVLETRNLDFDHLLILSCNEGNLPKGINDSSLIPYSVRKVHGLTTVDNKVSIYAYYFYRLIQRCNDVSITWNSSTEDGHTGQMSRFILQLMVEADKWNITKRNLESIQKPLLMHPVAVSKDDNVKARMLEMKTLSPSALSQYLRCQLLFYYKSVMQIKECKSDDVSDVKTFGTTFHKAMELLYEQICDANGLITAETISILLEEKNSITLYKILDGAFSAVVFNNEKPEYNGLQLIIREVMLRLCKKLLEADKLNAPFEVIENEKHIKEPLDFETPMGKLNLLVHGYIDRLDKVGDTIRVIDYKTGRKMPKIASIEEIFDPEYIEKHSDYFLQTLLYSILVSHQYKKPVQPALLFVQMQESVKDPVLKFDFGKDGSKAIYDVSPYEEEFMQRLRKLIAEIFDDSIPFKPTEQPKHCSGCPYRYICSE